MSAPFIAEYGADEHADSYVRVSEKDFQLGFRMGEAAATERAVLNFEKVAAETQDRAPFGKAFWSKQAALSLRMDCHNRPEVRSVVLAAEDMLAALRACIAFIEADAEDAVEPFGMVRAAIAKAEGVN